MGVSGPAIAPRDIGRDVVMIGLAAGKPTAAKALVGALYYETDTSFLVRNNGAAWVTVAQNGGGGTSGAAGGDLTGTYPNPTIDVDKVTFAKMQNVATSSFLGRITAATGDVENLTGTQATTLLDTFAPSGTGHARGLVPDPGASAGTTRFLREDATFAIPAGGSISLPIAGSSVYVYKTGSTYTAKTRDGSTVSSGTTAHTVINAAIDSVVGTGGGVVLLMAGTYTLTGTINLDGSVSLIGESVGGRFNDGGLLQPAGTVLSGALDPMVLCVAVDNPTIGYGQWIANIHFDNPGAQGTSKAITNQCMDTTVFNCSFDNYSVGWDVTGNANANTAGVANRLLFSIFTACARAVYIDRLGLTNQPTDGQILGCRFLAPTGTGFDVEINAGGWHIVQCHFTEATGGAKHLLYNGNRAFILNNYFDTSGMTYKIDLSGATESSFVDNLVLGSGAGDQMNVGTAFGSVVGNFFNGQDTATRAIRYNGVMTGLRGTCYGNSFANFSGFCIVDSAGEPIGNGFTAGAGVWPEFKADGNVQWT